MCTEMDRWSDPPMWAALVTEIVEQSISVPQCQCMKKGCLGIGKLGSRPVARGHII